MSHPAPNFRVMPAHLKRVLLVEDEIVNREMLTATLEQEGYVVETAADGRRALALLKKDADFGVLIADRLMPHLDGLGLFSAMQADATLRDLPLIMQTGAAAPDEIVAGIKAGVYYYLTKPYERTALLALVKSALRERQQRNIFLHDRHLHRQTLRSFKKGRFALRDLDDAQTVAQFLGSLFPRPELAVFGLYELLLNAIEHGNLGIGFAAKTRLLAQGQWENALTERLALPENRDKKVLVDFGVSPERIEVTITDCGPGFDARPYLEIEPARATCANGRGIAKANLLSFDQLAFKGTGNIVALGAAFT